MDAGDLVFLGRVALVTGWQTGNRLSMIARGFIDIDDGRTAAS